MTVASNLAKEELFFLNSIVLKSYNNTVNELIYKFRTGLLKLGISEGKTFEKGIKNINIKLSPENLAYIESIKIASKSHTIKLLIWFASQQIKE